MPDRFCLPKGFVQLIFFFLQLIGIVQPISFVQLTGFVQPIIYRF
jgi:hypothetical protein